MSRVCKSITAIVLICFLLFVSYFSYIKFPMIKSWFTHKKAYTFSDLQEKYDEGYDDGNNSREEDAKKIEYYKDLINENMKNIDSLNNIISEQNQRLQALMKNIELLNTQIDMKNGTISDLSKQIDLELTIEIYQLQQQLERLQKQIEYYQTVIESCKKENQVTVKFMLNDNIYLIRIVDKGTVIKDVENPLFSVTKKDNVMFKYWKVDDVQIDLSTYKFTKDTIVIAHVVPLVEVTFIVDDEVFCKSKFAEDMCPCIAEEPYKRDYNFVSWTLDGVDVKLTDIKAKKNMVLVARFAPKVWETVSDKQYDLVKDRDIDLEFFKDHDFSHLIYEDSRFLCNFSDIGVTFNVKSIDLHGADTKYDFFELNSSQHPVLKIGEHDVILESYFVFYAKKDSETSYKFLLTLILTEKDDGEITVAFKGRYFYGDEFSRSCDVDVVVNSLFLDSVVREV